jgi:hypothetical protein
MELELKVPKGKLPFVGIRFNNSFAAVSTHKEMVDLFKKTALKMRLERAGDRLFVRLISDSPNREYRYTQVVYDWSKLQIFLAVPTKEWNFGHIINVNGRDQVVKTIPDNKVFTVKLDDIQILHEY